MSKAMRDVFWEKVWREMASDPDIFVVTADFGAPALDRIADDFPERFISVGIAEQTLINVAAGLALEGRRVFAYAISAFFVRCAEQIRINLAMTSQFRPLNVTLVGVGTGLSYVVSGPSHHALEETAILRSFSGIEVLTPSDSVSAGAAFSCTRETGVRYLRFDSQPLPDIYKSSFSFPACGYCRLSGEDNAGVCLVSCGAMTGVALEVAESFSGCKVIDVLNMNANLLPELRNCKKIFTLEEGVIGCGGLDAVVRNQVPHIPVKPFGFFGKYEFNARNRYALRRSFGLTAEQIVESVKKELCYE